MIQSQPMALVFASCLPSALREKQAGSRNEFQRDSRYKNGQAPFFRFKLGSLSPDKKHLLSNVTFA